MSSQQLGSNKNWSIFSNQNGKCNQVEDAWKVVNSFNIVSPILYDILTRKIIHGVIYSYANIFSTKYRLVVNMFFKLDLRHDISGETMFSLYIT
jgi:hypothetical protein